MSIRLLSWLTYLDMVQTKAMSATSFWPEAKGSPLAGYFQSLPELLMFTF